MARQITVLDQNDDKVTGTRRVTCVFWLTISAPTNRVPKPAFSSKATAVTGPEQADLESGLVREEVQVFEFPTSYTTTQMKALINARYTDRATAVAAESAVRQFYGVTYDSVSGWSA